MKYCEDCAVIDKMNYCDVCEYNEGIEPENSSSRLAGPCGQQNCWYGCVVCKENGGCFHAND